MSNCKCEWLGFRYYNVYSDRMREGAFYTQVFPIFFNKINKNEPITIYGDGKQTMDLIHAKDIAIANILGMDSDVTEEFFNVGSGKETSVYELAKKMMHLMKKQVEIELINNDSQMVKNRKSNIEKIKVMLGFEPKISVDEGLAGYIKNMNS